MRPVMRKKGFTLVEVLVASLLLGMLVVILTMVFNQSSIAWRTGKASIASMNDMRLHYATIQKNADDALPGVLGTTPGRVISAWKGNGEISKRAVARWNPKTSLGSVNPVSSEKASYRCSGESFTLGSANAFTVGVWSFGPDGVENTADDISTWPMNVE